MESFLDGAISTAFAIAGLFFLRYWRDTRDRLFLIFASSFWLLSLARVGLVLTGEDEADRKVYFYLLRLAAYLLILYAILEKNGLLPFRKNRVPAADRNATGESKPAP